MKLFTLIALLFAGATNASAMILDSITYDSAKQTVTLEMSYMGGCKPHNFYVTNDPCMTNEAGEQEIAVNLEDTGWDDTCTDELKATYTFSTAEYCRPATMYLFTDGPRRITPIKLTK